MVNCDDEDGTHAPDNEDNKINGAPDPEDIAPLDVRRVAGKPVAPGGWRAFLEVSAADAARIRIFDTRAAGAAEVVGPAAGRSFQLPSLGFLTREFGMEAVMYPNVSFTGEISITLRIVKTDGTEISESAMVRVAPWVQFSHWDETEEAYVVETTDNAAFRADLSAAVTGAGFAAPRTTPNHDRWVQDVMEIGYTSMPKAGAQSTWNLPVVLRTANDRSLFPEWRSDLDEYPREHLLAPNYGWVEAMPQTTGSSLDSFGNLECSPPFEHSVTHKKYPFGRIVYGTHSTAAQSIRQEVREFLDAQTVQEPFPIDTGWLVVGHVDEVVSFCPMKNAPKKFKVLLASPGEAVAILTQLQTAGQGGARLFAPSNARPGGIRFDAGFTLASRRAAYPLETANQVLGDAAFMTVQTDTQRHIDDIAAILTTELGLDPSDFIHLPVLFKEEGPGLGIYVAYTPGVVNMLHLTKSDHTVRVCVPRPFGPVSGNVDRYARKVRDLLGPVATTGVDVVFIDDFVTYHVAYGEIHCGTNSKRRPRTDFWWWQFEP